MRLPGSWTVARPFGVPVRLHWSIPVCAFLTGRFQIAPGAWLAFLLLVLIHEAGHAIVVKRCGARPLALDVTGFGGLCWWDGPVTPIQRACIAWGGVWAQMVVFAVTGIVVLLLGQPRQPFVAQMVDVALWSNLWLMGVNLLPIPPLDGTEAWSLFPLLRRRLAARRALRTSSAQQIVSAAVRLEGAPITAPRVGASRVVQPREPRFEVDGYDEHHLTPEVQDVLEQVRSIVAREAARGPQEGGDVPEPGERKDGER